ncbi:MAG: UbiA family prenyltransferase [Planctomycetes bacterium]|nr:UbiA family prenyltransferase [Planctomycetota bacterium]
MPETSSFCLQSWWQLLRIGNVFTAITNILAGFLLVQREWQPLGPLFLLIGTSSLLYAAGMVLNDAFDAELDAKERPERPIPSGRISRRAAFQVGFMLLILGIALACLVSWQLQSRTSATVGILLAVAIVAYNAKLKQTEFGPSAMGICRYLNVLLGASIAADLWTVPTAWIYAAAVGMYTLGLTLFARSENEPSKTQGQAVGRFVTLGSMALVGLLPVAISSFQEAPFPAVWYGCLLLVCLLLLGSHQETQRQPSPVAFRRHVSKLLLGFIVMDALACTAAMGWPAGLIVLTLVVPPWIISRWAPMT